MERSTCGRRAGPAGPATLVDMICVTNLTKRYGQRTVVDDVSFDCAPGTVTGFLGPNGAGKSTTLRIICGLTRPSGGSATVAGVDYRRLQSPGGQVGILLDASAEHSGRTGREILTLAALLIGVDERRVAATLDRVGLDRAAARRRFRAYSLGMRQRLGLARALLGDPRLLILDEPANGLDPEGIHWMRALLRDFADRGGTVLLSSHLLREVEAVADQLVVINDGRVVARGAREELLGRTGTLVRARDPEALRTALAADGLTASPATDGALLVPAHPERVGAVAVAHRVVLTELRPAGGGLEELFLSLTGNSDRGNVERPA